MRFEPPSAARDQDQGADAERVFAGVKGRRRFLAALLGGAAALGGLAYFNWSRRTAEKRELAKERRAAIESIPRLKTAGLIQQLGMNGFLDYWNHEILSRLKRARFPLDALQTEIVQRGSIFRPAATADMLETLHRRVGTEIPPTLASLLRISNGVSGIIDYAGAKFDFSPAPEIAWLHEQDPQLVEIWTRHASHPPDCEYFQYGAAQDVITIRTEYLKKMIAVSPVVDGDVYLLNPAVRFETGELPAWDFSVKYPGAKRYQSLATLIEEHCSGSCWSLDYWSISHGRENERSTRL